MNNHFQDDGNFVTRFFNQANQSYDKTALILPNMEGQVCLSETSISYGALLNLVNHYQTLWAKKGWRSGDRIIVVIKPSKELYAISLSLLSMGMVPVFIDTGMGRNKIEMAVKDSGAKAIISMKALLKWYWLMPFLWPLKRYCIDGRGLGYQNVTKELSLIETSQPLICDPQSETSHGLISFTSGSTGRPKGADRTHYSLIQQHLAIRDHWPDEQTDIDCPCFPVMVLHNLSCGMTTVVPKVDLAEPAGVNAEQVIKQLRKEGVTRLSGAPAYLSALVEYLAKQDSPDNTISNITSLVVGGATVSKQLAKGIQQHFPNAHSRIVYGSTEAEPICDLNIDEYLAEASNGYLVGHVASQIDLLVSDLSGLKSEGDICEKDLFDRRCQSTQVGEIFVSGNHVLKQYVDNPAANRENKIPRSGVAPTKAVWHRTGDTGYLDQKGRLWLSGRSKDVLNVNGRSIQPYPIERILDDHPLFKRCALVDHQSKIYLFLEMSDALQSTDDLYLNTKNTLHALLVESGLQDLSVIEVDSIPTDKRHNSKVDRPQLQQWLINKKTYNSTHLSLNFQGRS